MTSLDSRPAPGSVLGTRVLRTEDPALLTGERLYVADLPLEGRLYASFVGSDVAHGTIESIHVDDALAVPGVVRVLTAADLGVAPHHGFAPVGPAFLRPPLADGIVRFVGESIALVLGETPQAAADGADAVWAEIDPMPTVIDMEDAFDADAPLLFPDHGSNRAITTVGDTLVPDSALDADEVHVTRGRYVNQRMAVAPMEPACCAAEVDTTTGRLTLWVANQMPHTVKRQLCEALSLDADDVRVVTPQVGGGFGGKAGLSHEYSAVAAAARSVGRPVVWVPPRSDDMKTSLHGRGQIQYVELGVRDDGTFASMRVRLVSDAGAYPNVGAYLSGLTKNMAQGTYRFDDIQFDIAVAVTNTTPMGAYRGAGRPEATAMLERLIDQAALEIGMDPLEIRRRNLLADDVFPYTTMMGPVYDSGRYSLTLDQAARAVGYESLRAEQAARRERGDTKLLGIGVASYVEVTTGSGGSEFGALDVHADGSATMYAGTQSHGQGHQTAYAMLVSEQTGIPVDRIRLVDGDTDAIRTGGGTGGSRSLQLAGSAVHHATELLVEQAREVAARMLEADAADIVVDRAAGTIGVAGVPAQALSWADVATQAEIDDAPLHGEFDFTQENGTFPFGTHISVVEVDRDTGQVAVLRHVAVDDCGTVIAPLLVEGQQHGGIAAGIGQALYEEILFDDDGNPVTSNFAEYGVPSAAELPSFETISTETPTPLNPLGAKGIGEAATIGSTPAVQNAVIDALAHLGVRHIDLPCTSQRVWQTIRDAEAGTLADPWREPPAIFAELRSEAAATGDSGDDAEEIVI
ncbi:MAG: xanthine dehydrogenase family protein molybdopterin-binding subunit [Ilumatobacter sp.]|uniref:xanthine dehydrogenase family protein molybdopterin-binding subunit n=2 Tax=Ilumatobacter sp. TaxID=1967498 RepID=UPI0032987A44